MNDIEIFDIYDIWYQPPWFVQYFFHGLIGLLLCFTALIIYFYYKRKKGVAKKCWQIALEKLEQLDKKDHKMFYCVLTDTLKNYLIARYCLDIRSKTDEEMVEYLNSNKDIYGQVDELKKIFNETTKVKFSHHDVDDSIVQEHLSLSIQVVKNTIPKEG